MQTTIPHFLFQNHVLNPLIKRFDPYIEGEQFVVFSAKQLVQGQCMSITPIEVNRPHTWQALYAKRTTIPHFFRTLAKQMITKITVKYTDLFTVLN